MTAPEPLSALDLAGRLAVAALIGLAAGIERERSGHVLGSGFASRRKAGVRTFLLLALLGGVVGILIAGGLEAAGAVLLAGGAAFVIAARIAALAAPPPHPTEGAPASAAEEDGDGTTEAAALMVLALAVLAGLGQLALAGGAAAVVALALGEKDRLHWVARRIGERELRATFQFAVLALVVLPVLPATTMGPLGGVNPRALWGVVLLFSALNFAGYLARRAAGPERGYAVAGILGGVVSSTAVTLGFARRSRQDAAAATALGVGTIGACTVLLARVLLVCAALDASVARALVPYVALPFVVGAAIVAALLRRHRHVSAQEPAASDESPLGLRASLRMAVAFQIALTGVGLARAHFGSLGVRASAAALGLTDVDALAYSMSRLAGTGITAALAAEAIAIGILANTVLKMLIAAALGVPRFRWVVAAGLAALGAALAGSLAALR